MTIRRLLACLGLAAMTATACTSGDDPTSAPTTAGDSTDGDDEELTGPAPGVTDDAIRIGVVHVDQEPLRAVGLTFDLGDYEAAYTALFDAINADGGINGRRIDYTILPVDPTATVVGEAECVQLTEDEDVFIVTGFFLDAGVLCPVETHATAVVGGTMTPERLERAAAPWVTWQPDSERPGDVVRQLEDLGELDGTVAVFAREADREETEGVVLPTLEDLGIDVTEVGISDAPPDDVPATDSQIQTIAERFESQGVDTVVLVGASAANWPRALATDPYRPRLLFLDITAAAAFANSADTTDTSILENSLIAGGYGPDQAVYDDAGMQDCIGTIEAAGIEVPAPDSIASDDPNIQPFQATFQACADIGLLVPLLEAAGENLNYATLEAAIDGLTLTVPGNPEERTFGPPMSFDGDPSAYFYTWDESTREFQLVEEE
jgi:hypothetical protein